jgi:hypothetical protein
MDINKIRELASHIPERRDSVQTEEATKTSFILPFIAALGYDVFNPNEVTPEVHADVGVKKGEKVDYAILSDGKPIILIECKWHGYDLNNAHMGQLHRYFQNTEARFGVLTNGLIYRFYTDLEKPNVMDSFPFFEFNLLTFKDRDLEELKKFAKSTFELDKILTSASNLRYTQEFLRILAEEMQSPSDNFVSFFVSQVYSGRITKNVIAEFRPLLQKALKQFISDQMTDRLKTAFNNEAATSSEQAEEPEDADDETAEAQPTITTTDHELEGYHIVRAILREVIPVGDIVMRDRQSYCGIIYKDNNRMPLCRLHFNRTQKYLGLFDVNKNEEREAIETVDDIYKHADRLKETALHYRDRE